MPEDKRGGRPIFTPPQGPGQVAPPDPGIYASMGEEGIRAMLRDFYAELEASPIRPLFPEDMTAAADKSALFFTGLCGGPPLYHQRIGPPRMRARHLPFAIDEAARREWLSCFVKAVDRAVEKHGFPAEHRPGFLQFLEGFSAWMVNAE